MTSNELETKMDDAYAAIDAMTDPAIQKILRDAIDAMGERIDDLEDESNIENVTMAQEEAEDAINRFLDTVDRPCGTRKFIIPETGERDRALIGLYDAIGRRL